MAGYSGTPLQQKLGIKDQARLCVLSPPWDYAGLLGLPKGKHKIAERPTNSEVFIHVFAMKQHDLRRLEKLAPAVEDGGMLWVSWPKKNSGVETDLTEEVVRQAGLGAGLVDVKVCAVDDVWSGLKFVRRLKDRKKAVGR